jgi:hypothetical protein
MKPPNVQNYQIICAACQHAWGVLSEKTCRDCSIHRELLKKEQTRIYNTGVGRYKKYCKKCGKRYETESSKKRYCPRCRDANYAASHRKAVQKHYKKSKMHKLTNNHIVSP